MTLLCSLMKNFGHLQEGRALRRVTILPVTYLLADMCL